MSLLSFNPLHYAERLEKIGLERGIAKELADTQMELLKELMEEKLVTKNELSIQITQLKVDLIQWMIGLLGGLATLLISVMALLKFFP